MPRRPRVRKAYPVCPGCGKPLPRPVQVWPALYVLGQRVPPAAVVMTVPCERHCGADVPVRGQDLRGAA